ncbi:glutamic acid-rich protein-like [Eucalyptus grandis]|uniref:glutamic acid-rich protein-like n=1 Tax=Eucalyptus grandis TaxID=71139 RepID=UPI00192EBAF4|nr:glutamic acid-rich protein-like [Eucalyptus grandis]
MGEEKEDDLAISTLTLRNLQGYPDSEETKEKEGEQVKEEVEQKDEDEGDAEKLAENENEDEDSEGDTDAIPILDDTEEDRENAALEGEDIKQEKRSSTGKGKVQEEEVSSQLEGTKIGGDHEKTHAPTANDGISRSLADAEDVFDSHFPEVEVEEETLNQDKQQIASVQVDVPSLPDTP